VGKRQQWRGRNFSFHPADPSHGAIALACLDFLAGRTRFGLSIDRKIGVGIFPNVEGFFVGFADGCVIAHQFLCPAELKPGRRAGDRCPGRYCRSGDTFCTQFSHRMGKQVDNIPPDTMAAFQWYSWPGNIRELQNLVERAVILSRGGVLPNSLHKIRIEVMPPRNIVFPLAHHR
jgi:hypothetical protein